MRLRAFEIRWAAGLVRALLPLDRSTRFASVARDIPLDAFIQDFVGRPPAFVGWVYRLLIWCFEWLPPILIGRFRRFSRLSAKDQEAYVQAWGAAEFYPLRQGLNLLKIMTALALGGEPAVQRALGYHKEFGSRESAVGSKKGGRDLVAISDSRLPTPDSRLPTADDEADFVVVGSGAAGATFARTAARLGASVLILEEGPIVGRDDYSTNLWRSMKTMWRDCGRSAALGRAMVPYLQARCVGGTTVINSGISWRLPDDIYPEWEREHGVRLDRDRLEACFDEIERDLNIGPTEEPLFGENNRLLKVAAERLGLRSRPTARNVKGCEGLSLCNQGCPRGHKLSMEVTYVPDALAHGATLVDRCRVERIVIERGRAVGVEARHDGGRFVARARRGVVVAASAVQSPVLLQRSGLGRSNGHLGRHFQAHPGIGIAALFEEPVRLWDGATQGYECEHFRSLRFKIETLALPMELLIARIPGAGLRLLERVEAADRLALWGVQVRCRAEGTVRSSAIGPLVFYAPTAEDCGLFQRAAYETARLFFAAGARAVFPGIKGAPEELHSEEEARRLLDLRIEPRDLTMAMTHLFGTCRMGPDPRRSVVNFDFETHDVRGLYVVDSSVFPTNLGVNPQEPIMALAMYAALGIVSP
ncbi:MAG: GMC family oxidoreductase [Nitrospirae bacterium]|nr:GMC family oxidoreductase [Nitrospirota bacterium]